MDITIDRGGMDVSFFAPHTGKEVHFSTRTDAEDAYLDFGARFANGNAPRFARAILDNGTRIYGLGIGGRFATLSIDC